MPKLSDKQNTKGQWAKHRDGGVAMPGTDVSVGNRQSKLTATDAASEAKPTGVESAKPTASINKIFTEEAAAVAREILRRKLGGVTPVSGAE